MKKFLLLIALLTMFVAPVVVAQTDTLVVSDGSTTTGLPAWLEIAIALVIAVIPSAAWGKAKYRLGKFAAVGKTLTEAMSDDRIDNNEIEALKKAMKELVAKEEK